VSPADGGVKVEHFRQYACAEYSSLAAIIRDYLSWQGNPVIRGAAIGSAGYPQGDTMLHASLPWRVSLADLRQALGLRELTLINDFVANAYGTRFLAPTDVMLISTISAPRGPGPILVLGPGTGLGAAVLLPGERHPAVIGTEAGHAAFAPTTDLEFELVKALRARQPHVANEDIVSGPGMVNLHSALCTVRGTRPLYRMPAEITAAALDRNEPQALAALEVFCGALGSIAGQLALIFRASGGLRLAGGILPRVKTLLVKSSFLERFHGQSSLRVVLEQVPVTLIENGQLA
jgi:glucokinase